MGCGYGIYLRASFLHRRTFESLPSQFDLLDVLDLFGLLDLLGLFDLFQACFQQRKEEVSTVSILLYIWRLQRIESYYTC